MIDRPKLHGRRKGRPLSDRRAALVAQLMPGLAVDLGHPAPSDPRSLFPVPISDLKLEIGCGGGEHLLHEASSAPQVGFIGVEPFREGLAKTVAAIAAEGCRNIRLHDGDAADVLDWLPPGSLGRIDLLYPDPWPKRRHWKRRFISPANLARIARALRSGGELRVVSDIPAYVDWTLVHVPARDDFVWTAATADDWRRPWTSWPGTRYEAKALRDGRRPAYLVFRRV